MQPIPVAFEVERMTWELWAIVLAVGFSFSFYRAVRRRARSFSVRHEPVELQVTALGLGTPAGQSLDVWLPVGTALPVHHRRILRVPSRSEELLVSLHTDDARLDAFANLLIGPLNQVERPVRLVELVIRVSDVGRVGFAAREKASGHRLKMRIEGGNKGRKQALMLPTKDAPPDSPTRGDEDELADISWHSVSASE
jgi:hypothetical protein